MPAGSDQRLVACRPPVSNEHQSGNFSGARVLARNGRTVATCEITGIFHSMEFKYVLTSDNDGWNTICSASVFKELHATAREFVEAREMRRRFQVGEGESICGK